MPVRGIILALSAGILWGLVPLYIKFVDAADPYEIVVQRAFWSPQQCGQTCGGVTRPTRW